MWINGGKHYQFMIGRDFQSRARFVVALHFGWRGDVPIGKTPWKHFWGFSSYHLEQRIKRWRILRNARRQKARDDQNHIR